MALCCPEIRMIGEKDTHQTAPGVLFRVAQTGTDFPIHVLPLPRARAYQHDCHGRIRNELIADSLANGFCLDVTVVYVAVFDRFVHNIVSHHALTNQGFVLLIVVVKLMKTLCLFV